MPRRNIQFSKGSYYHIYNRGAGRQSIFRQEQDYIDLLLKMREVLDRCEVTMIAYCLMPNHYHWLVCQDGEMAVSRVPKRVFGSYSQSFNHRYERTGTLFEGPYEAILVERDDYLRHLCRYIHANPVKHGIALSPALWPYSNYHEWIGLRGGNLLDRDFVNAHFPRIGQYEAYINSWLSGKVKLPPRLQEYMDGVVGNLF